MKPRRWLLDAQDLLKKAAVAPDTDAKVLLNLAKERLLLSLQKRK